MTLARHEIPDALRAAKARAADRFLSAGRRLAARAVHRVLPHPQHNVVGVGIGRKLIKNRPTTDTAIRLYVAHKLDLKLIPSELRLPPDIDGVPTDVVQVGRLRAQARAPSSRKRQRPAPPGSSIGFRLPPPHDDLLMAGTLGAVVVRDGKQFILSNNHVLVNENELPIGATIYQPGLLDHGDPGQDAIARLSQFVPLVTDGPNRVDCAIAEIMSADFTTARMVSRIGKLAGPEPVAAVEGMTVAKVGRGSGHTVGTVFDVSASITLAYELGDITFTDQLFIRPTAGVHFSEYGDSGALVISTESRRAVGLLIGGNAECSIANHIDDVLTELGVTLAV